MKTRKLSLIAAALIAAAFAAPSAYSQSGNDRTTDQFTCKDIMRESGAPREVTIAFMHGYLLGKSGATKFNIEALLKRTDAFIDRCLENPKEKAFDALMKVSS
jgi:hypothetical protein